MDENYRDRLEQLGDFLRRLDAAIASGKDYHVRWRRYDAPDTWRWFAKGVVLVNVFINSKYEVVYDDPPAKPEDQARADRLALRDFLTDWEIAEVLGEPYFIEVTPPVGTAWVLRRGLPVGFELENRYRIIPDPEPLECVVQYYPDRIKTDPFGGAYRTEEDARQGVHRGGEVQYLHFIQKLDAPKPKEETDAF